MPYGRGIILVDLEERESRARDLLFGITARANKGARKGGLACAEIPLEGNDVCGLRKCRDPGCERGGSGGGKSTTIIAYALYN
jgi:hypothetical protein